MQIVAALPLIHFRKCIRAKWTEMTFWQNGSNGDCVGMTTTATFLMSPLHKDHPGRTCDHDKAIDSSFKRSTRWPLKLGRKVHQPTGAGRSHPYVDCSPSGLWIPHIPVHATLPYLTRAGRGAYSSHTQGEEYSEKRSWSAKLRASAAADL